MIPSSISKVGAEAGHKIDFTTAKAKRKTLDKLLDGEEGNMPALRTAMNNCTFGISTQDQWASYLRELQKVSPKAAILSNLPAFCDAFADPVQPFSAPDSLRHLRDEKMDGSELSALCLHCKTLSRKADISPEQAHYIEKNSRPQHRSSAWYHFRIGRITASNMHAVYVSDLDKPALSTVKAVCCPNNSATNRCAATAWGRQNEERGQTQYRLQTDKHHCGFEMSQCGFIINPNFPQVGASPDGIVQCTCCGKGCVEIKCKYRDTTVEEACNSGDKNFCLEIVDGELQLKKDHPYYKQVQMQIFVTDAEYCDFVVWTLKDCVVLRVAPDPQLWSALLKKAQQFFECVCLPELVSCYFTWGARQAPLAEISVPERKRPCKTSKTVSEKSRKKETAVKLWCFCRGPESKDDMVACDNQNCPIVWFHLSCVDLQHATAKEDFWICSRCSSQKHDTTLT